LERGSTNATAPSSPKVSRWKGIFPPAQWVPAYQTRWLRDDLFAGITPGAYAIPEGVAYATLAGLPPQVGIYGYLLGGLGYALFGSSAVFTKLTESGAGGCCADVTPRSFSFLRGPSALAEVLYHRNMVRTQLLRLESQLRKSFPKSKCCFTSGSPPEEILRASKRINADLIIVPTSLDLISDCWSTASLIDELVRRANCPVLGVPSGEELLKHSKIPRRRDHGWSELNDSLNWNAIEPP
jgi:hypothetical protein